MLWHYALFFQDIAFLTFMIRTFGQECRSSLSVSIQNNFQILPVEDNWEKGVRKEFKPFSSEIIASQVSLVVTSVRLL